MLNLLFRNVARFSINFKLENYTYEDYATMCGLLRQKYQLHNQQIQTSGIIKLLDDANKVVGVYTASEARKKAESKGMDMVLVSQTAKPILCRATDFRLRTINRFYQEVVMKNLRDFESKASSTKSIKISPTLNKNENIVKLKQIIELSQKYSRVRVFMVAKVVQKQEALQRLEEIKSELMNKCYIEEEISNRRYEEDEEQDEKTNLRKTQTFSFVIRAKENNLEKTVAERKKHDPDQAIQNFLRKYYRQEDGDMMDLKSAGQFEVDTGINLIKEEAQSSAEKQVGDEFDMDTTEVEDPELKRQAEARILNKRLKVLLSLSL